MPITGDSMGNESESGTATIFWNHYWNLKSTGETGMNQVTTNKCKITNSDKYHEGRGSWYHQKSKLGQGGLLRGGDKELRSSASYLAEEMQEEPSPHRPRGQLV